MSHKIKSKISCLHKLLTSDKLKQKTILKKADTDVIQLLLECVYNILYNKRIKLSENTCLELKKYKNTLRLLVKPKQSKKEQKKLLLQKGGAFLPIILPTLINYLSTFLIK